jgi:hypothetical protein
MCAQESSFFQNHRIEHAEVRMTRIQSRAFSWVAWSLPFFGGAGLAHGQAQPDELLDLARRACLAMPGVTYSFEQQQRVGEERWTISGTARQARSANFASIGFTEGLFRFEGTLEQRGKKQPFALAYDGERLYVRNPGEADVNVIERPTMTDLFDAVDPRLQMIGLPPLSAAAPFEGDPDRGTMLRAGDARDEAREARVGDVACERIELTLSATAPDGTRHDIESTWAFGKDDHLPRRRDSATGRTEVQGMRALNPEEAADMNSFRLKAPPATQPGHK